MLRAKPFAGKSRSDIETAESAEGIKMMCRCMFPSPYQDLEFSEEVFKGKLASNSVLSLLKLELTET